MVVLKEEFVHRGSGQVFLLWVSDADGVKNLTISSESGRNSSEECDVFTGDFFDELTFAISDDGACVVVASYTLDANSSEGTRFMTISIPDGEIIGQWDTDERYGRVAFAQNSNSLIWVGSSSRSTFEWEYEVDGTGRKKISPELVVERELSSPDLFLSHELITRLE